MKFHSDRKRGTIIIHGEAREVIWKVIVCCDREKNDKCILYLNKNLRNEQHFIVTFLSALQKTFDKKGNITGNKKLTSPRKTLLDILV